MSSKDSFAPSARPQPQSVSAEVAEIVNALPHRPEGILGCIFADRAKARRGPQRVNALTRTSMAGMLEFRRVCLSPSLRNRPNPLSLVLLVSQARIALATSGLGDLEGGAHSGHDGLSDRQGIIRFLPRSH
jgi:hypothetical protein